MYAITIHVYSTNGHVDGRFVTAKGLHGLLLKARKEADPVETDWLHDHPGPKPFSLAPLYAEGGQLAGLLLNALTHLSTLTCAGHKTEMSMGEVALVPFRR